MGASHIFGDRRCRRHPRRCARVRKRHPRIPGGRRRALPGIGGRPPAAPGREPETDSHADGRQSGSTTQNRRSGSDDRPPDRGPVRHLEYAQRERIGSRADGRAAGERDRTHGRDFELAGGGGERGTHSSGCAGANRRSQSSERQERHSIRKSVGSRIDSLDRNGDAPRHHAAIGRIPAICDCRRRRGFNAESRPRGRRRAGKTRVRPESDGGPAAEHGHADARGDAESQFRDDGDSGFRQATVRHHRRASGGLPGNQCHHAAGQPVLSADLRKSQAGYGRGGGRFDRQYHQRGRGAEGQPERGSDSRAGRGGGPEHRGVERKDPDGGRHSGHGERYRGTIAPAGLERRY